MIVLDASAAIDWLLQTAAGQRIEQRIYSHHESLHAPHLLDLEVAQVLRRLVREGLVSTGRADQAIEDLLDLRITLMVFYVQARVAESPVWLAGAKKRMARAAAGSPAPIVPPNLMAFLPTFLFLILLMTAFMSFSHGTQDVYPTFLAVHAGLSPETIGIIGILYGFGSIAGGFVFGALSEKWGRKRAIVTAALLAIPVIPLYAYGHSAITLGVGAVLMQFMVQGAWGVVPAYLTDLSPAPVRATARGQPYQWGALIASWTGKGQALAAERWGN